MESKDSDTRILSSARRAPVNVNQVELRVADGTNLTKKDVYGILKAFKRFFENAQQVSAAGFQVKG
jgi:hypothetical protein